MVVDRALGDAALREALAARDAGADMDVLVMARGRPRRRRVDGLAVRHVPRAAVPLLVRARDVVHAHGERARAAVLGVVPCVTPEPQPVVDVPATIPPHRADTVLVGGELVARNRHADAIRALWLLRARRPRIACQLAQEGPERARLERLAADLGVGVTFGDGHATAALFALPSVEQESGAPYARALAAGVPAIGCRHEPGPERLARLTGAMVLVAPGDPEGLAKAFDALLADEPERRRLGAAGRAAVAGHLSPAARGRALVAAYERARR